MFVIQKLIWALILVWVTVAWFLVPILFWWQSCIWKTCNWLSCFTGSGFSHCTSRLNLGLITDLMAEWKCVYEMFINFYFYSSSRLYSLGAINFPDPITCFKCGRSLLQLESFPFIFIYLNHRRCRNEGFFLQIQMGSQCHLPFQSVPSPILNMNSILAVFLRWSLGSCLDEAQQFLHCLSKLCLLNSLQV